MLLCAYVIRLHPSSSKTLPRKPHLLCDGDQQHSEWLQLTVHKPININYFIASFMDSEKSENPFKQLRQLRNLFF